MENQFVRFDQNLHDPALQCKQVAMGRQCPYLAEEGKDNCPRHIGCSRAAEDKAKVRNYNLTKWKARVEEFAENEHAKSLREEIGIMRLMMETIINRCLSD